LGVGRVWRGGTGNMRGEFSFSLSSSIRSTMRILMKSSEMISPRSVFLIG